MNSVVYAGAKEITTLSLEEVKGEFLPIDDF